MLTEGHHVPIHLRGDENLCWAGFHLTLTALAKAHHICPLLAERQAQLPGGLLGGQQQMVAIGHRLMAQPKSILIDEMSLWRVF
jgi:branched-chain amino acid transport system ATP-binding protein